VVTGVSSPYTYLPGNSSSHNYQIRANNTCGSSTWSTATAGTDANYGVAAPGAPAVNDINPYLLTGVSITWSTVSGATGYDLIVDETATVTGVTSPYVYTPGDSNSHDYQVRATNASCTSNWSTVTAGVDAVSAPPETLGQTWSNKTAHTWSANVGATSYNVYRGTKADLPQLMNSSDDSCTKYLEITDTYCTLSDDPTGIAGGFYWYLVTGVNGNGEGTAGNASNSACGTPPCARIVNSTGTCP